MIREFLKKFLLLSLLLLSSCKSVAEHNYIYTLDFSLDRQRQFPDKRRVVDELNKGFKEELKSLGREFDKERNIPFDVFDLNDDGVEEIITKSVDAVICGNYDCGCSILLKQEKWNNVVDGMWCYDGDMYVLKSKTLGFYDMATKGLRRWKGKTRIWKWNGSKYEYSHYILEK